MMIKRRYVHVCTYTCMYDAARPEVACKQVCMYVCMYVWHATREVPDDDQEEVRACVCMMLLDMKYNASMYLCMYV